jgi:hypothetical protein
MHLNTKVARKLRPGCIEAYQQRSHTSHLTFHSWGCENILFTGLLRFLDILYLITSLAQGTCKTTSALKITAPLVTNRFL